MRHIISEAYQFKRRLMQRTQDTKDEAEKLKPGPERDALLKQARCLMVARDIDKWISSPGLRPPE